MFISVIITISFGININEATRYDLMSYGGLDAGRADMLIKERAKREITKPSDLKRIYGFKDYNISKLAKNFEIEPLSKPEPEVEPKPEVKVIEKNNYIYKNYPPYYEHRSKYGDIEIIERGSYGSKYYDKRRYDDRYHDKNFHHKAGKKSPKEIYKNSSHYSEDGGVIMGGSIRYKGEF
ncbi:hypothetical protein CCORG_0812 [Campylobacter corcagiensis]|nr:hypothetical protein CCORG_0812 [Campylobacter corcagiensis]